MNIMKQYIGMARLALLVVSLLLTACERRPLEDDYANTALVPVSIDWSVSGVPVENMHRASVWIFPANGDSPLEYRLEGNLAYREIELPVGIYSVLVFNETVEENDWEALSFTGTDHYETFAALTVPDVVRGFYIHSDEFPLVKEPEALAAWSLDYFEVTKEMVIRTRSIACKGSYREALENSVPALTAIKPLPRFERLKIIAHVSNLSTTMQATGYIDGITGGVYMASGEKISIHSVQAFILGGRIYDANEKDGTITRTFNILGWLSGKDRRHNLNLDFLLSDGTMHSHELFDATGLIVTEQTHIVKTHVINLGYSQLNGDHLIKLPSGMDSGISVDEWDEAVVSSN